LKPLMDAGYAVDDNDLMRHNLVVFRGGEGAPRALPSLAEARGGGRPPLREARLNLVVYHLRSGHLEEAHELIRGLEPSIPAEYILKATVLAALGQRSGAANREQVKAAQQLFNLVGTSASECDTIPGRQCMASCFFLLRQFEEANIYLGSVKPYLYNDDDFNWNYGLALAAVGNYKEAEETLLLVGAPAYTADYTYLGWLARCYIMNRKARQAWELYLRMDTSPDSLSLLQLIANDCYKTGAFYYAAKAFDVLERLDPDPEYWEGKRGACMGVFQAVIAGSEGREALREVLVMLRNTSNPQVEYITRVVTRWAHANGGL
jgi:intraflagellar transport protein 56